MNKQDMNKLIGRVIALTNNNPDGFTVEPTMALSHPNYKTGYMVGISATQPPLFNAAKPDYKAIAMYINALMNKVANLPDLGDYSLITGYNIGGWVHNGMWYIEISARTRYLPEAIYLGEENGQISIYDIANETCIDVMGFRI